MIVNINFCRIGLLVVAVSLHVVVAYAQQQGGRQVQGTVFVGRQPVPGASVTVKGDGTRGASTGDDGRFTLNIPQGIQILVV